MLPWPRMVHHLVAAVLIFLHILLLPVPARADITTGLAGWWKLDEASSGGCSGSNNVLDFSGNGNPGTCLGNPTYVSGRLGKGAISFRGTGSGTRIDLGNSLLLNPAQFTVSAWIYLNNDSNGYNDIYSNSRDCCGAPYNGIYFSVYSKALTLCIWNSSSACIAAGEPPVRVWTFATGTYDGATLKLYTNGVFSNSRSTVLGVGTPASFNSFIGAMGYEPATFEMNGYIDDVRLYNRALSAADVKELFDKSFVRISQAHLSDCKIGH